MNKPVIAAIILLAAALSYLYYTGEQEKQELSARFMEARAIPILAEFAVCADKEGAGPCQAKARACGLSTQDDGNDWKTVPQQTALKCVGDLAPNDVVKRECIRYVEKTYATSVILNGENGLVLKLIGSSAANTQVKESLEALGNCMQAIGQVKQA